jgi:acetyl-CoA C-acetyltransferase
MGERVAIVGIGQTCHTTRRPDVNWYEMVNEAVRAALKDAELEIKDIDAVVIGNMDLFEGHYLVDNMAAEYSGAFMKPGLKLGTGGTTGGTLCAGARHLVASGLYDVVLTIGWEKHDESHAQTGLMTAIEPLTERPFTPGAIGFFAMMSMDYMSKSGCQEVHGAMVRVKAAENASKNPYAHLKLNITVDDVLKSPMLSYPLRMEDKKDNEEAGVVQGLRQHS